jgi:hypothetical protein
MQVVFILVCKDSSTYVNNVIAYNKQGEKPRDPLNRCKKSKIQHPFMIKALKNLGIHRMFLNMIKYIRQTCSQHYTKWRTTETIPAK